MAGNGGLDSFEHDDFDDDAFDNIPPQTLQALEQNALHASQPALNLPTRPHTFTKQSQNLTSRYPLSTFQNNAANAGNNQDPQEEVVNLDDYALGHGPTYNTSHVNNNNIDSQWIRPPMNQRVNSATQGFSSQKPYRASQSGSAPDHKTVIQRLEKEKLVLKQNLEAAQSRAQAKSGEAAILRQRLETTKKEYEQKIESLNQAQLEAAAQTKSELDAVKKEREKIETDRRFLEHDMASGAGKSRPNQNRLAISHKGARHRGKPGVSHEKNAQLPFGDGFQDDGVPLLSPSKNRLAFNGNRNGGTSKDNSFENGIPLASPSRSFDYAPTATPVNRPEKRRRANDTPDQNELLLLEPDPETPWQPYTPFSPDPDAMEEEPIEPESKNETKLRFFQQFLDFRIPETEDRLLEVFGKHSLPSKSDSNFAKQLLDKVMASSLGATTDPAITFVESLCELWTGSIRDEYFVALDLIIAILQQFIATRRFTFIKHIVIYALQPAMETVNLLAYPISAKSYNESQGIPDDSKPPPTVNIQSCLDLIELMSLSCANSPEHVVLFWTIINTHWVLCLLMEAQPVLHVTFICNLLRNSATTSSFGPIFREEGNGGVKDQDEIESLLVERLTSLLYQVPAPNTSQKPLELEQKLSFRLSVLDTLWAIALPPRSGISLAVHSMAIGRIIEFLYATTSLLYEPSTYPTEIHDLAIKCVNTATRLLYHILTKHAGRFDLREKLKMVPGGAHLHLLALTRLAFCEAIVLERGIEPAVSDAAHALLDEFLSPVEGEQLLKMFPSADSTGVSLAFEEETKMDMDTETGAEEDEEETMQDSNPKGVGTKEQPMEID